MNELKEEELMDILGYGDPSHSVQWYKDKFPNLPEVLKKFIKGSLNSYPAFPKGADKLEKRRRYQKYYIVIEKENDKYVVRITDTDRGEISKEKEFKTTGEAADYLILNSYSCGGSIKSYWGIK